MGARLIDLIMFIANERWAVTHSSSSMVLAQLGMSRHAPIDMQSSVPDPFPEPISSPKCPKTRTRQAESPFALKLLARVERASRASQQTHSSVPYGALQPAPAATIAAP
ncbi:hypothetical protein IP84_02040 [beta proteobacterium AAP99]|nr:hypothetical protein IP84_02040 [beta proteobacterium AAP99]